VAESKSRWRGDFLALAGLSLLSLLFFADVLFGDNRFYIRDVARYYHPTKTIIREIVLAGEFPWWNPHYSAGQPLAANPEYEVFYPLQWPIFLPDFDLGFRLHIIIHLWMTTLAMYAFLRSLRLKVVASSFGAIAWGLGGLMMSLINLLPILFAVAWVPLILLFTRRCLRRFSWSDAGLAAIAGGMQILVGEPTTLVQTWLIVGAYVLWRMWKLRRKRWRSIIDPAGILLLVFAGSVAIGSVQLFPAADHATDTVRSRGFELELATAWSLPPARVIELAFPHVFGHIDLDGKTVWWAGGGLYQRPGTPFFFNIYCGAMLVPLLIAGISSRGTRRWELALFSIPFIVVALGHYTPLYRLLYEVGVPVPFRYPEKFFLSVVLAVILFASFVLQRVIRGDRVIARKAAVTAIVLFALAGAIAIFSMTKWHAPLFFELWGAAQSRFRDEMIAASRRDWLIATLSYGLVALLLVFASKRAPGVKWGGVVLLLLVAELASVSFDVSPRIHRSFYQTPELAEELPPERSSYRVFHEMDWYGGSKTARRYFSTGEGVYWVVRNGLYPMTAGNYGFRTVLERDYDRTALLPSVDLVQSMWEVRDQGQRAWAEIVMGMSNAWYRAKYRDFDEEIERVGGEMRWIRPIDLNRETSAPRYYFASELRQISAREEFVEALVREVPPERVAFVGFAAFEVAEGKVLAVQETSSSITLEVESEGEGYLVLSVTPHRYWRAWIDDREVPLEVTNIGYQGLRVPQGRHTVRLVYRNPVILATAPVSILALLMAIGASALGRRRHDLPGAIGRRSSETPPDAERVGEHLQ
jgi:hypothetical protein